MSIHPTTVIRADANPYLGGAITVISGTGITLSQSGNSITVATNGSGSIAIGDSVIGGTSGSILFVDSANKLAQDNANLFWDNTVKSLNLDGSFFAKSDSANKDIYIGSLPTSPSGANNTLLGFSISTGITSAAQSTIIGVLAGASLTTGLNDTLVGYNAGGNLTTGQNNTAVGVNAIQNVTTGNRNTIVGKDAGASIHTSDSDNTLVGYLTDTLTTGLTNAIAVGSGAIAQASNSFTLGGDSTSLYRIHGVNYTWPAAQGAASTILTDDGTGVLSWTALSSLGVTSVSNSDGTLTISPTTGAVVASLNLAHANTWTGQQTFSTSAPIFSTMTLGSVFFAGSGGLLSQDNAQFFWDDTNFRLGIGTATPNIQLEIGNSGTPSTNFTQYLSAASIAHGMTTIVPTNVYGALGNVSTTNGGLGLSGFSDTGTTQALVAVGTLGSNTPTATIPAIELRAAKKNVAGTGRTALASTETVLNVTNNGGTPLVTVLGNGSLTDSFFTTNGGILYTNASGVFAQTGAGTSTTVLHGGTSPSYSAVSLTADVSGTLPVTNGGTGTATAFTQGSVVFAGASGVYSQNNANFFWDDTNTRLGIGTASPNNFLTVAVPAAGSGITIQSTSGTSDKSALNWKNSSGTEKWRIINDQNADLTDDLRILSNAGATNVMAMLQSGDVSIGGTTPGSSEGTAGRYFDVFSSGALSTASISAIGTQASGSGAVGTLNFVNSSIGGADNRIGIIQVTRNGANNSGDMGFNTYNAGVAGRSLTLKNTQGAIFNGTALISPSSAQVEIQSSLASANSLSLFDTRTEAANQGGNVIFTGYVTGTSTASVFASVQGIKENSTSTNTLGALRFSVNEAATGSTVTEVARFDSTGRLGVGTTTPNARITASEAADATQTTFTQGLGNAGFLIKTNFVNGDYTPGLFWSTSDNNSTKPKAGIYLLETNTGTNMLFGTSNSYSTGVTNTAIYIDTSGKVGISNTGPTEALDVTGNLRLSGAFMPNNLAGSTGQILQSAGAGAADTWSTATYPATAGSAGNQLMSDGTNWVSADPASSNFSPADPATTTSTTGVMMGLGTTATITTVRTTNVLVIISGDIDNTNGGDGSQVQIRFGTGTAPANGAALTGTTAGGLVKIVNPNATGLTTSFTPGRNAFSLNAIITVSLATATWIDVGLASITGGTSRIRDLSVSLLEV